MKRLSVLIFVIVAACGDMPMPGLSAGAGGGSAGGRTEYLVLGSNMSFDECRQRGGFIIHDQGSSMYACDPKVVGAPVPVDEFNHPIVQPQSDLVAELPVTTDASQ